MMMMMNLTLEFRPYYRGAYGSTADRAIICIDRYYEIVDGLPIGANPDRPPYLHPYPRTLTTVYLPILITVR